MYRSFYSLTKKPFKKSIKTNELFESNNFSEASARLNYLKTTKGIGIIVGEPGSGKTSTLRAFKDSLNPARFKVIYYPLATGSVNDFYKGLNIAIGNAPGYRKISMFNQLQGSIQNLFHKKKITPVFILDEMQLAPNKFLNELSILFNFSMDSENPFILILSGLPHFIHKLSLNQNQSLYQRVIMKYSFNPLNKDEVKKYIEHQLEIAGANHDIFSPSAIEAIATNSNGLPRIINNISRNALILGFQLKAELIDEEIIRKVISGTL